MTRFLRAIRVIARRDFTAILFSRSFLFFLAGPLLPVIVGGLAGGIGASVGETHRPTLGLAMESGAAEQVATAGEDLRRRLSQIPELEPVPSSRMQLPPEEIMASAEANYGAILSGTLDNPVLSGPPEFQRRWGGPVSILITQARRAGPPDYARVSFRELDAEQANQSGKRIRTAQAGQTVLFLLTMLLAGMVLSNLVEEKGNKIIEILAAAVPMDAVFMGKLLAMLGVSLVGIAVWGAVGGAVLALNGGGLPFFAEPAVGWPLFLLLGVVYFACAYLLLGSLFLTIGALASTVREVQTLSMPVTMLQLLVFFFASFTLAHVGEPVELLAIIMPFSSPFAMLARAAVEPALLPHVAALCWQALCVVLIVRTGARLFRRTVMNSGSSGPRKSFWRRLPGVARFTRA